MHRSIIFKSWFSVRHTLNTRMWCIYIYNLCMTYIWVMCTQANTIWQRSKWDIVIINSLPFNLYSLCPEWTIKSQRWWWDRLMNSLTSVKLSLYIHVSMAVKQEQMFCFSFSCLQWDRFSILLFQFPCLFISGYLFLF